MVRGARGRDFGRRCRVSAVGASLPKGIYSPMEFRDVVARFAAREPGTHSFKELQRECLRMITADPTNAALYFVLAELARAYWQRYDDEPVTVALADDGRQILLDYASRLLGALDRETELKLSALNSIVLEYQNANTLF